MSRRDAFIEGASSGQYIAFADTRLWVLDNRDNFNGSVIEITPHNDNNRISSTLMSADGKYVIAISFAGTAFVFNNDNGKLSLYHKFSPCKTKGHDCDISAINDHIFGYEFMINLEHFFVFCDIDSKRTIVSPINPVTRSGSGTRNEWVITIFHEDYTKNDSRAFAKIDFDKAQKELNSPDYDPKRVYEKNYFFDVKDFNFANIDGYGRGGLYLDENSRIVIRGNIKHHDDLNNHEKIYIRITKLQNGTLTIIDNILEGIDYDDTVEVNKIRYDKHDDSIYFLVPEIKSSPPPLFKDEDIKVLDFSADGKVIVNAMKKNNSLYGFYQYDLKTQQRHLLALVSLEKKEKPRIRGAFDRLFFDLLPEEIKNKLRNKQRYYYHSIFHDDEYYYISFSTYQKLCVIPKKK
jgi:WD40 repeat protein